MIDPELGPFLAHWRQAWSALPPDAPATARRAMLTRLADEARRPLPSGLASHEMWIEAEGRRVRLRLFERRPARPAPALVYMHGGGWMQGSPETHDAIAATIAERSGFAVLSVDYALAPERPFPAALLDCKAVIGWLHAGGSLPHVRRDLVAVGGDSAGGNLAAVLCLELRGTALAPSAQLLFYPAVDCTQDRPSHRENADGPIITTASLAPTLAQYCADQATRRSYRVSPLRAADHRGLPPAFVAVAEHDPLRDEGLAYAETLAASGVAVELDRGAGLIHGYLRALDACAASRRALDRACLWLTRIARPARAAE